MLEESLELSRIGIDLRPTWKRGDSFSEDDRFDFEQAADEIREALNAGKKPVCKMKFQDLVEYGSLRHGAVS